MESMVNATRFCENARNPSATASAATCIVITGAVDPGKRKPTPSNNIQNGMKRHCGAMEERLEGGS